jgi:hypothetical protein
MRALFFSFPAHSNWHFQQFGSPADSLRHSRNQSPDTREPCDVFLLIRPQRIASPKSCHPERSAAKSKDLQLLLLCSVSIQSGRINSE